MTMVIHEQNRTTHLHIESVLSFLRRVNHIECLSFQAVSIDKILTVLGSLGSWWASRDSNSDTALGGLCTVMSRVP